jgi:hypothetical protein
MASPVVNPNSASMRGKQTQVFTANQSVNWSVTRGTLSTASGASTTYTAPNREGTYVLTADNGVDVPTLVTITVEAEFPFPLKWDYDEDREKKVLIWEPQDGPWQSNVKRGTKSKIDLKGGPRPASEFPELDEFWDEHHGRANFILKHPDRGIEIKVRADSLLKITWKYGLFTWSGVVREV